LDLLWVGPPGREDGLIKAVDEVVDGPADIIVEPLSAVGLWQAGGVNKRRAMNRPWPNQFVVRRVGAQHPPMWFSTDWKTDGWATSHRGFPPTRE